MSVFLRNYTLIQIDILMYSLINLVSSIDVDMGSMEKRQSHGDC
jgi:hypothetical protein